MFGFGLEEFALDVQILDFFQTDFFARFSPSSRIDRLHIMDKRSSLVNDWPGWVAQHATTNSKTVRTFISPKVRECPSFHAPSKELRPAE